MNGSHTDGSILSIFDIVEKYNKDPQFLAQIKKYNFRNTEIKNQNGTNVVVENPEGNCCILKIDSLFYLVPRKGYNFNLYQFNSLQDFYALKEFDKYKKGKFKEFIIEKLAEVNWDGGKLWNFKTKGVLIFVDNPLSPLSENSQAARKKDISTNQNKDQEIEKTEERSIETKEQVEQYKNKELIISEISDRTTQQSNIALKAFKQEILNEIGDRIPQQPNINLESFKKSILNEIKALIPQQSNIDLESLKEEIINEISDRIPQQPNIDLESFKEEILDEVRALITQQSNNDLDSLKQEILNEIRESKQKKKNNLESSPEPISLEELQSLIESYNSNPGLLASESTMVAATRESIEQRRTGFNTPIIFTQTDNDSYWIIHKKLLVEDDYFYLVPKANLIINSRIYQTIEDIFVCHNYVNRSSNKFKLVQPAIVKLIACSEDYEDQWELVEPGKLNFS